MTLHNDELSQNELSQNELSRREFLSAAASLAALLALGGAHEAEAANAPAGGGRVGTSYFDTGRLFVVSSSHQDTGWMDTPAACRQFRIERDIMPALEMMHKDPKYTFCMEATLHLMEFLEAHPEMRGEIIQRMKEGRLEFGATYNQPYESWLSGEELIRETYYGRRWIMKNLPGCDARVAFNADPPERSLQMQQILAKAGIPYMFISRYREGLYQWLSPDGTSILVYTPGHYSKHLSFLNNSLENSFRLINTEMTEQSPYYQKRQIPPVHCLINTTDFAQPTDFSPLIAAWNAQAGAHPAMGYGSMRGFFETINNPDAHFDTIAGERPDVWVYITGPTHHWTASVKREAARLLPAAETFTTIACLLAGNFDKWPAKELDAAWKDEIYMDHGIGGNNGHITDAVFHHKIENARDTGRNLLDKALGDIASQVKSKRKLGTPVTVFNDLSWQRSGPVEVDISADAHLVDADGKEIPHQMTTLGRAEDINVAIGAKASADSMFSADYDPAKAVDGRWDVRDPNPETGPSSKWNSAVGNGPHWLALDFGQPRSIHKVVIRHEGVIGAFGGETKYNTADYQIQGGDTADGPWIDLVPAVVGNTASLTTHSFAPKTIRFLRLYITKGAACDSTARIYEVQAFQSSAPKPRLLFIAADVPALGYKTYCLAPGKSTLQPRVNDASPDTIENNFYRIKLAPGGIASIFDKQQNRELLKTDKFLGGEVFTMLSVAENNRAEGTDAGEFGSVLLPVMDASFDRVSIHKPAWKVLENGTLRTVYQLEQPMSDTTVRQRVVIWHSIKRIDCEVDLNDFNGTLWREYHMALPLAAEKPTIAYEVPMGVVEIGKDELPTTGGYAYGNLNYTDQCRDIHPRMMQNFVDASDSRGGLTMSSSVSVFDWVDPTTNPVTYPVIQPVLLATRKSCNGTGVWYPQAGTHNYRFSLTTHEGGWRNGRKDGIAANHPLHTVVGAAVAATAGLPTEQSFASVTADNLIISTLKKCEDDNSVIARIYEVDGRNSDATVKLIKPVQSAKGTNLIEEEGKSLTVTGGNAEIHVGHHAIETIKLNIK